ncbi:probable mediator of RNA polymerase II transcription subunit 26c isoform X1 [Typha latifolia]|uniref:probable mediator of RNA polymerase II transcription subunit 26c isoform X1 n=1 Tax=Typha latifolia TaxID=4733 RepID=UPI003C2E0FDA
MDPEDLNRMLRSAGVDLWDLIETAIDVAARDHAGELRMRRDAIVERLYAAERCRNCEPNRALGDKVEVAKSRIGAAQKGSSSESMNREEEEEEEEEEDEEEEVTESEQRKILAIKDFLEDPDQPEDSLISLLQNLADMDITFKALKETDIGKQVNLLRKNPSGEVRRLAKQLLRKWKDLVDEWVKSNSASDAASPAIITDGDSPQQIPRRDHNNGHHVQEFAYSPIPHKTGVIYERNGPELAKPGPQREGPPTKPNPRSTPPSATPAKAKEQKDNLLDAERLASARKRLHENYQEAQNAKKQRTIQVMDIHEIPKAKNSFVRKSGVQAKHW